MTLPGECKQNGDSGFELGRSPISINIIKIAILKAKKLSSNLVFRNYLIITNKR